MDIYSHIRFLVMGHKLQHLDHPVPRKSPSDHHHVRTSLVQTPNTDSCSTERCQEPRRDPSVQRIRNKRDTDRWICLAADIDAILRLVEFPHRETGNLDRRSDGKSYPDQRKPSSTRLVES